MKNDNQGSNKGRDTSTSTDRQGNKDIRSTEQGSRDSRQAQGSTDSRNTRDAKPMGRDNQAQSSQRPAGQTDKTWQASKDAHADKSKINPATMGQKPGQHGSSTRTPGK